MASMEESPDLSPSKSTDIDKDMLPKSEICGSLGEGLDLKGSDFDLIMFVMLLLISLSNDWFRGEYLSQEITFTISDVGSETTCGSLGEALDIRGSDFDLTIIGSEEDIKFRRLPSTVGGVGSVNCISSGSLEKDLDNDFMLLLISLSKDWFRGGYKIPEITLQ
ncbi:Hypothetical predicted protein [Mytilus galloprovincialis]|uniref:Uncharacterized protein n=1 Tax=Mytilus galloprovincialis TaxID=29158 RepID=A0A8B6BZ47_MYTGA|nr:Hypothetical predicted protein [Mytilus galloprovincialis]